jgi:Leucine-rich repeat (LRR) protein
MEQKKNNNLFMILMIALTVFFLAGITVTVILLLSRCKDKEEVPVSQTQALPDDQGVPDSVVRGFFQSVPHTELTPYTDYTYTVRHDVTLETTNSGQYIYDNAHIDMRAKDEYDTYAIEYDVIFVHDTSSEEWGFTTYSFTTPKKAEGELPPVSEPPVSEPTISEPPVSEPPVTNPPETTPPAELPDSFMFGGATIKKNTTSIDGKEKKINGDKNHFVHITKDEVDMLALMCPDLETLDLDYCWFDTYEPLGKLTKLRHLELKSCGTSKGGVPMTNIDWIKPLVNLKKLSLCHNAISDLSPLLNLTKLEYLQLGDNKIKDDQLAVIAQLENLTELYLYRNSLTDASPLTSLTKLKILNLANNKIKTVEPLAVLNNLQNLIIYSTKVDDLSYFPNFKALKVVNLAGCPLTFHDYYDYLPLCPKLKKFRIYHSDSDGALAGDAILNDGYDLDYEYYE